MKHVPSDCATVTLEMFMQQHITMQRQQHMPLVEREQQESGCNSLMLQTIRLGRCVMVRQTRLGPGLGEQES